MGMAQDLLTRFSGSRLSTIRIRAGLSRQMLAQRCATAGWPVSHQQVRRIELDESTPRPQLAVAFAVALGVDLDELLAEDMATDQAAS